MSIIVFCNIGNRDIVVEGETGSRLPARIHGEKLLAGYGEVETRLQFPIITPAIEYILEQHNDKIDTVVFFGTDQPDDGAVDVRNVPFRDKDTVNYAQLIQRYFKKAYGGGRIGRVALAVVRMNPSLYDEAFDEYETWVAKYLSDTVETCYLIAVGGTPACNTALLLQGVRLFGERCRTVYAPENRQPHEMQTGLQVFNILRENTAVTLLQRQEFAAAAIVMQEMHADETLIELANYASARIAFDFARAQAHLQSALNRGRGTVRSESQRMRASLQPLIAGDEKALIAEVTYNARICWDNGRYVDFLGRIFRFEEAILRYTVGVYYDGIPTDEGDKNAKAAFVAYIETRPGLKAYLSTITLDGRPLNYTIINRTVLRALLQYVARGDVQTPEEAFPAATQAQAAMLLDVIARIARSSTLRNKSIVAHGYGGVSQELIESAYNNAGDAHSPLDDLLRVCGALSIDLNDPFRQTADFIISQLRAVPGGR